ncbi:MAG: hypothetical protein CMN56_15245 [Sneathiella sp.]|uniref:hypothetical protein n=1 Tax=Sneathiella sp. TaxID=1964365 RepID=UPI000C55FC78|nr:hypothetical protein [Sneathiella sp.]MAZ04488.1 hypothetical protein [Sneathiella sp.]
MSSKFSKAGKLFALYPYNPLTSNFHMLRRALLYREWCKLNKPKWKEEYGKDHKTPFDGLAISMSERNHIDDCVEYFKDHQINITTDNIEKIRFWINGDMFVNFGTDPDYHKATIYNSLQGRLVNFQSDEARSPLPDNVFGPPDHSQPLQNNFNAATSDKLTYKATHSLFEDGVDPFQFEKPSQPDKVTPISDTHSEVTTCMGKKVVPNEEAEAESLRWAGINPDLPAGAGHETMERRAMGQLLTTGRYVSCLTIEAMQTIADDPESHMILTTDGLDLQIAKSIATMGISNYLDWTHKNIPDLKHHQELAVSYTHDMMLATILSSSKLLAKTKIVTPVIDDGDAKWISDTFGKNALTHFGLTVGDPEKNRFAEVEMSDLGISPLPSSEEAKIFDKAISLNKEKLTNKRYTVWLDLLEKEITDAPETDLEAPKTPVLSVSGFKQSGWTIDKSETLDQTLSDEKKILETGNKLDEEIISSHQQPDNKDEKDN